MTWRSARTAGFNSLFALRWSSTPVHPGYAGGTGFNSLFALRWSSTPRPVGNHRPGLFQFALCAEVVFDNNPDTDGDGVSEGFQFALCAEVVFDPTPPTPTLLCSFNSLFALRWSSTDRENTGLPWYGRFQFALCAEVVFDMSFGAASRGVVVSIRSLR